MDYQPVGAPLGARTVAVTRISPLAAFKVTLALSLIGLIAWLIAVTLLYAGMEAAGVWVQLNSLIGDVGGSQGVTFGLVLSVAILLGAICVVFSSVMAPVVAVIYNGVVGLIGGVVVDTEDIYYYEE